MNSARPHIVGIAGATCSGKSHLARSLEQRFRKVRRVVIPCDSYYRDLSTLEPQEREKRNFDTPEAIEQDLLFRHVETLAGGRDIHRPVYDFVSHTRAAESVHVVPGDLIIVEGLFALYWPEIRRMMHTKVFVWLPEETGLARRLERDVVERGRTPDSVVRQYLGTVKPMNDKYVLPTRAFADIMIDGTAAIEQSTDLIFDRIMSRWERQ
jgi:uridine kinase